MTTLKISERFYSIQGEGRTTGVPAYFIRLTDCNLSCGASQRMLNKIRKGELNLDPNKQWHGDLHEDGEATWTCDSVAVWIKGRHISFDEIIQSWRDEGIYNDILKGTIHIIWTGGEPALPYHQEAIVEFTECLDQLDNRICDVYYEIETNGTIYINTDLFNCLNQINCSLKLSNSGMPENKRINKEAIERIKSHENHQFKFVVGSETEIEEALRIVEQFDIDMKNVYMMPALDDQSKFHEMTNFIYEMAKKYKFIATQRLHISSWGAVTGV